MTIAKRVGCGPFLFVLKNDTKCSAPPTTYVVGGAFEGWGSYLALPPGVAVGGPGELRGKLDNPARLQVEMVVGAAAAPD
jgi:hypothetical protein